MNKHIWYITKYFSLDDNASVGSRSRHLIKEFAKHNYKTTVITSDSNNLTEMPVLDKKVTLQNEDGFDVIWLKTLKYSVAKSILRILSWVHFEFNLFNFDKTSIAKPDVVIVSSLSLLTIINGIRIKRQFNCKLIFEIRDIWPLTLVEEGGFSERNPLIKALSIIEKWGYQQSDIIVGTMPNLKQHVTELLGYEKPVHCIPMGINNEMVLQRDAISEDYIYKYLNKDYFNIVHAGTVGITNALDTFFAAAEVLHDDVSIRFVIVGDGALKETYQNKYKHLDNLIFAPKVSKTEVGSVLSNSDLVYFSTFKSRVWDYGQSLNKVIDYMLSGKPILASYSGYPSMINEANCGFFVPAEDVSALVEKIKFITQLPSDEREKIGMNGRNWLIKNRLYSILAERYLNIMFEKNAEM